MENFIFCAVLVGDELNCVDAEMVGLAIQRSLDGEYGGCNNKEK